MPTTSPLSTSLVSLPDIVSPSSTSNSSITNTPAESGTPTTQTEKTFNLWLHDEKFSLAEIVIAQDLLPDIKVGDIVEIFHPDKRDNRLLLQIKKTSFSTNKGFVL
jgi:hypothetical protein